MVKEKRKYDTVSVIIPIYNEEKFISRLVDSLICQDYNHDYIEFIFVDGDSTDASIKILRESMKKTDFEYRILHNSKRFTPISLNVGIKAAKNDIIIRFDAHCEYPLNYISKCVYYLNKTGADNVGCICLTKSNTKVGGAIADVVSSSFGVGNSQFRIGGKSGYVDTVPFGTFRRSIFEKIGYFNEELIRSEDNEFNHRIITNGGKIYMFNDIYISYYPRDTITKIMKMGFENGKWGIYTNYFMPGTMKLRHFVPFLFVISLIMGIVISILNIKILKYAFVFELLLYLLLDIYFSFKNIKKGVYHCVLMFIVYPLFHIAYGVGSIFGIGKIFKKYMHLN